MVINKTKDLVFYRPHQLDKCLSKPLAVDNIEQVKINLYSSQRVYLIKLIMSE